MDLAKKYRPKKIDDVVGQPDACRIVANWIKTKDVPHTIMLSGPSGCGKTTLARILASELKCAPCDMKEINAADARGIDTAREIRTRATAKPMGGDVRVWIIDEAHQLTKDAQNALLKVLEEPPPHGYYLICTTEPAKLLKTIITRCTEVKCKSVRNSDLQHLVDRIWTKEKKPKFQVKDVIDRIAEVADGSPRKAVKILESVIGLEDEEAMLTAVQASESREFGFNLAKSLLFGGKFKEAAKMLENMEDEPETVRQIVMSYCTKVMLSGGKNATKAAWILTCFKEPIYSAPKQLLALAVFDVFHASS